MGALLLVTLLDLSSASTGCVLTGRPPHLHEVTVQPTDGIASFLINVDDAPVEAVIPGIPGAPVEITVGGPVQFRGSVSRLAVRMNAGLQLDLRGGAELLHPRAAGGEVVADIDLDAGMRAVGVKLPCASLTLDRLEHAGDPRGDARWQSRRSPLVLTEGDASLTIEMDHPERIGLAELERSGDRVRVAYRHGGVSFNGWVARSNLTRWNGRGMFWIGGRACVAVTSGDELVLPSPVPLFAEPGKGRWATLAPGTYLIHRRAGFASIDHLHVDVDGVPVVTVFDEPACPSEPLRHAWIRVGK